MVLHLQIRITIVGSGAQWFAGAGLNAPYDMARSSG